MNRTLAFLALSFFAIVSMHAQTTPSIGDNKDKVLRLFGQYIQEETPNGGLFLRMPIYEYPANVFVGFKEGKAFTISVSFIASSEQNSRLALFKDVRKRIESLPGRQYSYARIEGVDVLGESGGWVPDKRKSNAIVFGIMSNGLVYQVEIFGTTVGDLTKTGDVELTIDEEESIQPPNSAEPKRKP